MSTSPPSHQQGKKNFDKFFDKAVIDKMGRKSRFEQRRAKKISPYHFVFGFFLSCFTGRCTFREWALQIGSLSGKPVSKQAVFDRLGAEATSFARQLVEKVLLRQSGTCFASKLFAVFNRVLLQDSTTLRLPQVLSAIFPGNRCRGEQKAVARIQAVLEIKAMKFMDFSLAAFTNNDQSASGAIMKWARKGDLVIRDMGYSSLAVFGELIRANVHFLSRFRFGINMTDMQGRAVPLKGLLKQKSSVDRLVCIGGKARVPVRLVMIPLPAGQAAERVRRARNDRDKRLNHTSDYYKWLGYNVYITTVGRDIWTATQVREAYRVRWQIEIIFKSWKTGFHLQDNLHEGCTNEHRVRTGIFLMLLFICLFMQKIYVQYKDKIEAGSNKKISLLKLSMYTCKNFKEIMTLPDKVLEEIIGIHCCYEKRPDRTNMTSLYQNLKS